MALRQTEAKGLVGWIDQRLSIVDAYNQHLAQYWAPKNFNVWYFFGSCSFSGLNAEIFMSDFGIQEQIHFSGQGPSIFALACTRSSPKAVGVMDGRRSWTFKPSRAARILLP